MQLDDLEPGHSTFKGQIEVTSTYGLARTKAFRTVLLVAAVCLIPAVAAYLRGHLSLWKALILWLLLPCVGVGIALVRLRDVREGRPQPHHWN